MSLNLLLLILYFNFNFRPTSGLNFDPNKVREVLEDLMDHPREVIDKLETYKIDNLFARLAVNYSISTSISETCHEELKFLGYGMIEAARRHGDVKTAVMSNEERKSFLIPMMDAAGKIGSGIARGHILSTGAFSECKNINMYSTSLHRTVKGDYFRILFDIKMRPHTFHGSCELPQIGVDICLPWSCRNDDLTEYFRQAIGVYSQFSPVCSVQNVNGKVPGISTGTYLVLALITLITLIAIISGVLDYYQFHSGGKENSLIWKMFMAFSIYRNIQDIFDLGKCKKEGQVTSLNCIRTISTVWVIFGHCASIFLLVCSNPLDLMDFSKTYLGTLMASAYFAVDTFFFISAFLLSFLWFKQFEKNPKTVTSAAGWTMFYVHRIARLSPVYYITILFFTFVYTRMVWDMPLLMSPAIKEDTCRDNYWLNLLYVNNLVDTENICYVISWYLAADLQLYIFSPVLLLGFAIFGNFIGFLISAVFFWAFTGFNAYQIFFWHFPPSNFDLGPKDPRYNPEVRRYDFWNYYNPLIRCQIYIMGLVLGYFMRKTPKLNINPWLDRILWILSLSVMISVILIIQNYASGNLWSPIQTALYSCFSRVFWGFSLSWIVISTYYRKGLINDFMSLPFWTPLAKLSFCAYLIHIMVSGYFFGKNHSELYFSTIGYFVLNIVLPVTVLSFTLAIFWSALFEVPFAKIEALIFEGGRREKSEKIEVVDTSNGKIPIEEFEADIRF